MKAKTITFNNGKTLGITQDTADSLKVRILKGGSNFQIFTEDGGLFLLINIDEISFIK